MSSIAVFVMSYGYLPFNVWETSYVMIPIFPRYKQGIHLPSLSCSWGTVRGPQLHQSNASTWNLTLEECNLRKKVLSRFQFFGHERQWSCFVFSGISGWVSLVLSISGVGSSVCAQQGHKQDISSPVVWLVLFLACSLQASGLLKIQ